MSAALALVILSLSRIATASTSEVTSFQTSSSPQPGGPGRVVATVTVLDGTVRIAGADVELRSLDGNMVLAKTISDGAGQVTIPDVPPGRYLVRATRPGFEATDSAPFEVSAGEIVQVLLDIRLTYVAPSVEVRAPTSPTQSVQPVSTSDMLSGSVLEIAPLEGDDFQSLLPLLPGVLRGPDGRLRAKGGQPTQGALQISSASLIDPSSGDFDLQLPGQSIESVELLDQPLRRRVRPLFDQRGATAHQARNQRLGNQAGQFRAPVPQRVQRGARLRASLLNPRAPPRGSVVPRAGFPVSLRQRPGQEPARRAGDRAHELRLVYQNRQRAVAAAYARRRWSSCSLARSSISPCTRSAHPK